MMPFLLDENSGIGLVINAFWFLLVAPVYIGALVLLLAGGSRSRKRGMVLAVGLAIAGLGAGLAGLLPITATTKRV